MVLTNIMASLGKYACVLSDLSTDKLPPQILGISRDFFFDVDQLIQCFLVLDIV